MGLPVLAPARTGCRPRQSSFATADSPSCWPDASCAATAKQGPVLFATITVSNPLRGCVATAARLDGCLPASTRQVATSVAPFQLTYTAVPRDGLVRSATAGLSAGYPAQSPVNARYDWSPLGSCPFMITEPSESNSV